MAERGVALARTNSGTKESGSKKGAKEKGGALLF